MGKETTNSKGTLKLLGLWLLLMLGVVSTALVVDFSIRHFVQQELRITTLENEVASINQTLYGEAK
jgi:hypothetical protein